VAEGIALTRKLRATVAGHLPALTSLRIGFTDGTEGGVSGHERGHEHANDHGEHHQNHPHPHG
jgi:hypothetical protein